MTELDQVFTKSNNREVVHELKAMNQTLKSRFSQIFQEFMIFKQINHLPMNILQNLRKKTQI